MVTRLTIDQLMMLEILTAQEHTVKGIPRKKPRLRYESRALGITDHHHTQMKAKNIHLSGVESSKLKQLLAGVAHKYESTF